MGEELEVTLGVELEHAVDVLDPLQRVGVPDGLGGEQVDDLEGCAKAALDGERGVEEEVLRLGLNLEHHQVLHGDELNLLTGPLADAANLLEGPEAHRRSADAARARRHGLRGPPARDDQPEETTAGLVVRDAVVDPYPVGQHALMHASRRVNRRFHD